MKKLLAMVLAVLMALGCMSVAMADEGSEPDWTEYDALIAEIKSTTDFAYREELMHKAEDILMATNCIVPIYYYNDIYMMKDGVEGFYANVYGTKFFMHATYGDNSVLRINLASEPDKLDPALNSSVDGACLAANSFGGLYTYNADGELEPNFATDYTVSEDGMTYVFTMREGLKWSDGSELNAKDFEWSWKRAANPETAADYSYMLDGIARDEAGELMVTASEDGATLTVVLSAPCAYMLDLMAFPTFYAVKQSEVEGAEGYLDADGNIASPGAWALEAGFVSSGAYVLESWVHNESMVYVKNPNYWDAENVKIEKLEFMLSDDDTIIYAAYQAGDLDFIDTVPNDQISTLLAEENPEFYIADNLGTYYICFNVKSPMFDGLTVEEANTMRHALSILIDRDYIVETIGQTGQQVATSFIPAGMLDGNGGVFRANDDAYTFPMGEGYLPEDSGMDYIDQAVEELKSIGFKFDDNNMLSAETPIAFEYLTNDTSGHIAIAEAVQQDLAMIGVNMTLKTIDWNTFLNERKAGNYDIARNGWLADFNDPINMLEMWTTESGNNDIQFGR